MQRSSTIAILLAASLAGSSRAGEPVRHASHSAPAACPCEGQPQRGKLANVLFGKREHLPPGYARPILIDHHMRYEPKLRDIRYVPFSSTLPGSGLGAPDTLPVIPPYRHGYYRVNSFR